MRDDERFEMMRAMDLLPQVAGASFATTWFRLGGQRRPTREEYRAKTAEYFANACRSLENFPDTTAKWRSGTTGTSTTAR